MHYDTSLEEAYEKYINDSSVKQAHRYIVGLSKNLSSYSFFPKGHGYIRDYRYMKGSAWNYALAINKNSLTFYFRPPSFSAPVVTERELKEASLETTINQRGEIKVRIYNTEQAKTLMRLVFGKA